MVKLQYWQSPGPRAPALLLGKRTTRSLILAEGLRPPPSRPADDGNGRLRLQLRQPTNSSSFLGRRVHHWSAKARVSRHHCHTFGMQVVGDTPRHPVLPPIETTLTETTWKGSRSTSVNSAKKGTTPTPSSKHLQRPASPAPQTSTASTHLIQNIEGDIPHGGGGVVPV